MKRPMIALALAAGLLGGCARHYVITLNNGSQVGTIGKPRLKGAYFVCKDALGRSLMVPAGQVREVAPGSGSAPSGGGFVPTSR